MAKLARVIVAAAAVLAVAGSLAAQDKNAGNPEEIRALLTIADEAATGKATSSLALQWDQQHFIKSFEDKTYVPFTVSVDPSAFSAATPVGLYLRVAKRGELPPTTAAVAAKEPDEKKKDDKKGDQQKGTQVDARHQYAFEDVYFFDLPAPVAGQRTLLRRAFAVAPGDYDVYVRLRRETRPRPARPPRLPRQRSASSSTS
jgi:Ni/Co efflux regulator RcnB